MARKRDINYFDILITASEFSHKVAVALDALLKDYTDVKRKAEAIHDLEHAADKECHQLLDALNVAFITPIDREDIYQMIRYIDDITDLIEDVANRLAMFDIKVVRQDAIPLGELIVRTTAELEEALHEFKIFKKSKKLRDLIRDINTREEEGDKLYRSHVRTLFTDGTPVIDVIKWKDIYDDMENVLDACEDVANIMEGVVMKNS